MDIYGFNGMDMQGDEMNDWMGMDDLEEEDWVPRDSEDMKEGGKSSSRPSDFSVSWE